MQAQNETYNLPVYTEDKMIVYENLLVKIFNTS